MKKKILEISTVGLGYEGITNIIFSYLEAMDRQDLDLYIAATINVDPVVRDKFKKIGCHVIDFSSRKQTPLKYMLQLAAFIHKNKIEIVHAHGNSGTLAIEMLAAWLGGCKRRIAHSHNTHCDQVKADKLLRPLFNMLYTDAIACGDKAGKWLFGGKPFMILNNGRNIEEFAYNQKLREQMRKKFGFEGQIVLGHVGSFVEQKNHQFLIRIFRELLKFRKDVRLVLIGTGPLKSEIENSVKDIKKYVLFIGSTNKISAYLQMMDGMLLPSLFEGLPLVTIEWQICALPCLVSENITKDCAVTELLKFMSLDKSPQIWAKQILEMITQNNRDTFASIAPKEIKEAGFDITDCADILKNIYMDS